MIKIKIGLRLLNQQILTISCLVLILSFNTADAGELMYVTDRVILGVHQTAAENSVLVSSLPSGTKVEILESEGNFARIKLDTGVEGWIKTEFLIKEKPSILVLGEVTSKLDTLSADYKKLKDKSVKRERDLQTREDQVANAKSSIRDFKKQIKTLKQAQAELVKAAAAANSGTNTDATTPNTVETVNELTSAELDAAKSQIMELQKQIEELQNAAILENVEQDEPTKVQLNSEIKKLLMRIKVAQANLNGEEIPSPEELAAIQPQMPLWYWVLLGTILLLGFVFGSLFIDYMHRKKHGGFRL